MWQLSFLTSIQRLVSEHGQALSYNPDSESDHNFVAQKLGSYIYTFRQPRTVEFQFMSLVGLVVSSVSINVKSNM